jgi:glutathione peroxidase
MSLKSALFVLTLAALIVALAMPSGAIAGDPSAKNKKTSDQPKSAKKKIADNKAPALCFKMKDVDDNEQDLRQYSGKVVLMVNVASNCGFTPQYAGLQKLYESHKDKGLVILAFPANDFGKQEPGSNSEIKEYCTSKYHVTFPIFAKVSVMGREICPLYKYLTGKKSGHKFAGPIQWNFNKFLVNRKGEIIGRYDSRVAPDAKKLTEAIDKALAEPAPIDTRPTKSKKKKPND